MLKSNTPLVISNVPLPTEKDEGWLKQDRKFIQDGEWLTIPECKVRSWNIFDLFIFQTPKTDVKSYEEMISLCNSDEIESYMCFNLIPAKHWNEVMKEWPHYISTNYKDITHFFPKFVIYIILLTKYLFSVESQYYYIIGNIGTDAHRDPENSFGIAVMGK